MIEYTLMTFAWFYFMVCILACSLAFIRYLKSNKPSPKLKVFEDKYNDALNDLPKDEMAIITHCEFCFENKPLAKPFMNPWSKYMEYMCCIDCEKMILTKLHKEVEDQFGIKIPIRKG